MADTVRTDGCGPSKEERLYKACQDGDQDEVRELLAAGADPNWATPNKNEVPASPPRAARTLQRSRLGAAPGCMLLAAGWRARGPVRSHATGQYQLYVPPPGRAPRWWPKCGC